MSVTPEKVYDAIRDNLREFGYPSVTSDMLREIHEAMVRGEKKLPHGVIGMFAEDQIKNAVSRKLLTLEKA